MTDEISLSASPRRAISYRRLSTTRNEIRLLIIEPLAPEDTRIRCHLEHASLFDLSNEFVALSYHWGDHADVERILLADHLVSITFSLYKALEELRRRGVYRVWVDDLCINQHDDDERSQQVLRMGAIYRGASMVFAHIRGPGLSYEQGLANAVQCTIERTEAPKQGEKHTRVQARKDVRRRRISSRSQSVQDEMPCGSPSHMDVSVSSVDASRGMWLSAGEETALLLFLDSPYWRRVWIIQEISINPRLVMVWGQQVFDQLASKPLSLVEALGLCYEARTHVDRDRVFGLLGLAHDGAYLVPVPSTGSLDIVISKPLGMDTWYPNWFDPRYWHAYRRSHLREVNPSLLTSTNYGSYRASGYHTANFRIVGVSMIAQGFFLGSITDCSPTLDEARLSKLPRGEMVQSRLWRRNAKNERVFFTPESAAIMKMLCWLLIDITGPKARGHRRTGTHLQTLLYRVLHKKDMIIEQVPSLVQWLNCCEAQGFKINDRRFVAYLSMKTSTTLSAVDRETLEEDCRLIQKNLKANMRLGYTDEGQMGWFNDSTRVGDQVAILLGASMPCVLRGRPAGGYTAVGQCIVDGVMKGEAVKDGLLNLQDIRLY